jgi:hypothetical protein
MPGEDSHLPVGARLQAHVGRRPDGRRRVASNVSPGFLRGLRGFVLLVLSAKRNRDRDRSVTVNLLEAHTPATAYGARSGLDTAI